MGAPCQLDPHIRGATRLQFLQLRLQEQPQHLAFRRFARPTGRAFGLADEQLARHFLFEQRRLDAHFPDFRSFRALRFFDGRAVELRVAARFQAVRRGGRCDCAFRQSDR